MLTPEYEIIVVNLSPPKAKFSVRVGDTEYLNFTVFLTKADPTAEVIVAEIRLREEDNWTSRGRLAVFRSPEGTYKQLADRERP
jgi:hypothetical protein